MSYKTIIVSNQYHNVSIMVRSDRAYRPGQGRLESCPICKSDRIWQIRSQLWKCECGHRFARRVAKPKPVRKRRPFRKASAAVAWALVFLALLMSGGLALTLLLGDKREDTVAEKIERQ